jgi:hypothetical protein
MVPLPPICPTAGEAQRVAAANPAANIRSYRTHLSKDTIPSHLPVYLAGRKYFHVHRGRNMTRSRWQEYPLFRVVRGRLEPYGFCPAKTHRFKGSTVVLFGCTFESI